MKNSPDSINTSLAKWLILKCNQMKSNFILANKSIAQQIYCLNENMDKKLWFP